MGAHGANQLLARRRHKAPAAAYRRAVEQVLDEGYRTADIWREGMEKVGCTRMGELVAQRI